MLPRVDHGSPDVETSLRMIRASADAGTTVICCTPHLYRYDPDLVERARSTHADLRLAVEKAGIAVDLLLGFEVDMAVAAASDIDILRTLCIHTGSEDGSASTGTLIVEMPFSGRPLFLEETVRRSVAGGLLPVIAHPERNDVVQSRPDVLKAAMEAGAMLQGTAGSLTPMFRKESQKTFRELLARGWFSVLASDAHSQPDYTWSLGPLLAELGSRLNPGERELLVSVNPGTLLQGRRPVSMLARPVSGRRRRLFG